MAISPQVAVELTRQMAQRKEEKGKLEDGEVFYVGTRTATGEEVTAEEW